MKEANSFPTKIMVCKQSDIVFQAITPFLSFTLSSQPISQYSSLPLPTSLFVSSPVPQKICNNKVSLLQVWSFIHSTSFSLPKWNFRFCKFKKLECSLVTFCIFPLLSAGFSWLTQICISCFGLVSIYQPK